MERKNGPEDVNERIRRLIELDKSTLPADGGPRFNRLIFASSPYLLQHAENPVDWYQWGEEAFAMAEAKEKPIFLSIGYATCHWCHVMEHEAFEDAEVAEVMNRLFVAIKVDREERPDIDEQYMTVSQMMTGSGGWPLNIFMTPDRRPFFAATYLPKAPRQGMPGIIEILEKLAELWRLERGKIEQNCATTMEALSRLSVPAPGEPEGERLFREALGQLEGMFDPELGGFGRAPKFPMPHYLSFLLRLWRRDGDPAPLAMVGHTLRMIRYGGIYDQIGFGIHRYAVDRQWLVPHFEKMLYDQALLAIASLEAFQATGDAFCLGIAEEIFAYVEREMTFPEGGFYSGQDADTDGEEGRYYIWTPAEITTILGEEAGRVFCRLFGVTEHGNFEGRNILHLPLPPEAFASREGISPELLAADLERWQGDLLAVRERRIRPFRDEKVLAAWNGLMIAALARGYAVTGEVRYLAAAERGAAFLRERMRRADGRLLRSFHLGAASIPAFLEDYACCVWGLIELHQATLEPACLNEALGLSAEMLRLFGDDGGLFEAGSDAEQVLVRRKSGYDGVIPSGNSVAAMNLLRLGRITGDARLLAVGEGVLRAFMGSAERQPVAYLHMLSALDYLRGDDVEITLVGPRQAPELLEMLRAVHRRFIPGLALRHAAEGVLPGMSMLDGRPAAYVCTGGACRPPVAGAEELGPLLDGLLKPI